jgi:hypothetical protein
MGEWPAHYCGPGGEEKGRGVARDGGTAGEVARLWGVGRLEVGKHPTGGPTCRRPCEREGGVEWAGGQDGPEEYHGPRWKRKKKKWTAGKKKREGKDGLGRRWGRG